MRIGCVQACGCISSCYEFSKQALAVTIIKINTICSDVEALQKACVVSLAIIRGINFHCHTHYLPHFIRVLDVASTFDFYGFCRFHRLFLHPYRADRLDEYAILDELEVILCDNWHLGVPDDEGRNRDDSVRQYAKKQMAAFLQKMAEEDWDFRTEDEVKTILHHWFEKTLEAQPEKDFNPHDIDLGGLKIALKEISWLKTITTYTFVLVDIACIPDFLQMWGLINLAPCANAIGRFPLLSWVPNQRLDEWIWGTMGVGHFLLLLSAVNSLWKEKLTASELKDVKWIMAASLAECVYCLSIVQRKDPRLINYLAMITKSLGLIAFLIISKPTFFNDG